MSGRGWVYLDPGVGWNYSLSHPIRGGGCYSAEHIRPSTLEEDFLWFFLQRRIAETFGQTPTPTLPDPMQPRLTPYVNASTARQPSPHCQAYRPHGLAYPPRNASSRDRA